MSGFQDQIIERLQTDKNLPSVPSIVHKLLDLVSDENASIDSIADVIAMDPAISAQVLRLANSAAFAGSQRIGAVDQAILRIGLGIIKDVVLSLSVINIFKASQYFSYQDFWKHALAVAFAAQSVEKLSSRRMIPTEELYMCGLVHDLGILILDQFMGDHYLNVLEEAKQYQRPLHEVERDILGIDHAAVGAILVERWQLPQVIIDAVRYHHDPTQADQKDPTITRYVHVANFACNNQQIKNGIDAITESFVQSVWFDLKLSITDISIIIGEVNKKLNLATEMLNSISG